jgi:hypothetical protein
MIAEKLEAMVKLGDLNSRMKDFYDIWIICRSFDFNGETLAGAIVRTFAKRGTDIPASFADLSLTFAEAPGKRTQWAGFLRRNRLDNAPSELRNIVSAISGFLNPVVGRLLVGKPFSALWTAPGPWREEHV